MAQQYLDSFNKHDSPFSIFVTVVLQLAIQIKRESMILRGGEAQKFHNKVQRMEIILVHWGKDPLMQQGQTLNIGNLQ